MLGLAVLAVWLGSWAIVDSGKPGSYYQYRHYAAVPEYPTADVIEWVGAIAVELGLAIAFIVRAQRTSSAVRLLAVALLAAAVFLCLFPFAMHAPPYFTCHLIWLMLAAPWLLLTSIAAAIESRLRR